MTHKEFVRQIAQRTEIAQKYVREILEAATDLVKQELVAGRGIKVHNLGVFKTRLRAPRTYQAPAAGRPVKKPATVVIKFKPVLGLKLAVK